MNTIPSRAAANQIHDERPQTARRNATIVTGMETASAPYKRTWRTSQLFMAHYPSGPTPAKSVCKPLGPANGPGRTVRSHQDLGYSNTMTWSDLGERASGPVYPLGCHLRGIPSRSKQAA